MGHRLAALVAIAEEAKPVGQLVLDFSKLGVGPGIEGADLAVAAHREDVLAHAAQVEGAEPGVLARIDQLAAAVVKLPSRDPEIELLGFLLVEVLRVLLVLELVELEVLVGMDLVDVGEQIVLGVLIEVVAEPGTLLLTLVLLALGG